MEYLVNAIGEVPKVESRAYVVEAASKEEAQEIAKKNFEREFACEKITAEAQSYTRKKRSVAACILMAVAIILSFFKYSYEEQFLFFFSRTRDFSISPEISSCIYAIIFYVIYVIRFKGIQRAVSSKIDIAFTVLSILLISTFFNLILSSDNLMFLYFFPLPDADMVLLIAIIASMLGVKLVSVACMAFIAITAVSNISVANTAMGFIGVIYIMCSFVGVLLYLSVEPAVLEALPQMKASFANTFKVVKKDFVEARSEAETIISKIPK